jgi:hypothetical protein
VNYRRTNPNTRPPSDRKDSSAAEAASLEQYPQATATRIAVVASLSDPSAVSNRTRPFPPATPKP